MRRWAWLFGIAALAVLASCSHLGKGDSKVETKIQYLIDVRSQEEYAQGHLLGAVLIPHTEVAQQIASVVPDKGSSIALYCRSGRRAGLAKSALEGLGYQKVTNFGGMEDAAAQLRLPIIQQEHR